jgi:deazaflavin-dependent oxidoreductase (nitroreductase family)
VDGLRWRYVVGGRGERTILVPSGETRVPDMYLLLFEALEPHFRVISPCYPAARTMDALVEGLAAVLDAEGVGRTDLFGSSFGGFVAQCFVRRHPERVRSLVLANTGAPGASPLPGLPLLVRLFARLPEGMVRRATGWNWRRWFVAPPEEQQFWHGLLDELLASRLTKADLVSATEEMLDFTRNYRFGPRDLEGWPGRILVIESENDEAFSPRARAELRALYPQARVRTFAGSGHAVMVSRPAEYVAAVRSFLEEPRTTIRDTVAATAAHRSAAFPLQRPSRLVLRLFKGGARAYRGPLARFMGTHAMLLLTTTGRRSGLPRRTTLTYQDLGGSYLVLAGMGVGSDWYRNLLAQPRLGVRIGARRFAATAQPVLDPGRRRTLAPGIAAQWDRFGPPRPLRWALRRWLGFDYDAELAHALAHAEDLPMVELVPSGSKSVPSVTWPDHTSRTTPRLAERR